PGARNGRRRAACTGRASARFGAGLVRPRLRPRPTVLADRGRTGSDGADAVPRDELPLEVTSPQRPAEDCHSANVTGPRVVTVDLSVPTAASPSLPKRRVRVPPRPGR